MTKLAGQSLPALVTGAVGGALATAVFFFLSLGLPSSPDMSPLVYQLNQVAPQQQAPSTLAPEGPGTLLPQAAVLPSLQAASSVATGAPGNGDMRAMPQEVLASRPLVIEQLIAEVQRHAGVDVRATCEAIIRGAPGTLYSGWSQSGQDWLLFHNYLWQVPYGEGQYVDIGSHHPQHMSNTFFFDRCLGWKGLCIEPNPEYHPLYSQVNRTCTLIKHCLNDHEGKMFFKPDGSYGHLLKRKPKDAKPGSVLEVECKRLPDVLAQHSFTRADLASIDIEGAEVPTLRCFPFGAFHIGTWVAEINKSPSLSDVFLRAGYARVLNILTSNNELLHSSVTRIGRTLDAVFRLQPTPMLGPKFLPGQPLFQAGPQGACVGSRDCAQQATVVQVSEVELKPGGWKLKDGECRLPVPKGSGLSEAAFVHPLRNHPNVAVKQAPKTCRDLPGLVLGRAARNVYNNLGGI